MRVEVRDPDYTPELQGRLGKLEAAISKQRTVRFDYWSIARDDERERTINPYALLPENGTWYVIGLDLERPVVKSFRVSRIRSEIRFATRRERDFRVPESFDIEEFRGRADWQFGEIAGEARIEVAPDTAWWVQREYAGPRNRVEDGVFVDRSTPRCRCSRAGSSARTAAPSRSSPPRCAGSSPRASAPPAARTRGRPPVPAAEQRGRWHERAVRAARPGPVAPERFGVLQSLLAYLLAACGEEPRAPSSRPRELVERFSIPPEALEEHLSLLNLVNFGGGCYAVYAELHGDEVHVDKELFGDTFRRAPRLTPLEARAIRLALEFVGPMVAAGSSSPLDRVRAKLEEAFGAVRPRPDADAAGGRRGGPGRDADPARSTGKRLVELEYLKPESTEVETRTIEPYGIERRLPHWYVHTWDVDRDAPRSYRLDRTRTAKLLAPRASCPARASTAAELRHATTRAHLVLAGGRALGGREGRPAARRRRRALGARRSAAPTGSSARCSRSGARRSCSTPPELRALVATRARELERRLREARATAASRRPSARARRRSRCASGRVRAKVEPCARVELTSSVPPWASAIARAM